VVRLAVLLAACPLLAHGPITTKLTWTKEISRIVYKRCATCHRENGTAPFAMLTYEETRPWATAIKEEVLARRMPPWGAIKGFGEFEPDLGLTQEEIHLLADWVEGGAPEGEPQFLPSKPNHTLEEKERVPKGVLVEGRLRLRAPMKLAALRPAAVEKGASLKVVARTPRGLVPLLWLYEFDPRHVQTYRLRDPVPLPAGTLVEVDGKGSITLLPASVIKK